MKHPANYTIEEFREKFSDIPYEIVDIVYGYYHRDKSYSVEIYARSKHISVATVYRYVRRLNRRL